MGPFVLRQRREQRRFVTGQLECVLHSGGCACRKRLRRRALRRGQGRVRSLLHGCLQTFEITRRDVVGTYHGKVFVQPSMAFVAGEAVEQRGLDDALREPAEVVHAVVVLRVE